VRLTGEPSTIGRACDDNDEELVRQVLRGGLPGEHAGLELLLRRRPECWQDATALVKPNGVPPHQAIDALTRAWRTYRRIEPTLQAGRG
jgi:hypothetical protein